MVRGDCVAAMRAMAAERGAAERSLVTAGVLVPRLETLICADVSSPIRGEPGFTTSSIH